MRASIFFCVWVLSSPSILALAQKTELPVSAQARAELAWQADQGAASCFERQHIVSAVHDRLGRPVFDNSVPGAAAPTARIEAKIESQHDAAKDKTRWQVRLTYYAQGQIVGKRTLRSEAQTCEAFLGEVVFVIALMLDPEAMLNTLSDEAREAVIFFDDPEFKKEAVIVDDDKKAKPAKAALPNVKVRVRGKDKGLVIHQQIGNAVADSYKALCRAPCELDLAEGTYRFAISKGTGKPIPVKKHVNLYTPTNLQLDYKTAHIFFHYLGLPLFAGGAALIVGGLFVADDNGAFGDGGSFGSDAAAIVGAGILSMLLGAILVFTIPASRKAFIKVSPLRR